MTIYEAMGLSPGVASARLLAACSRVREAGARMMAIKARQAEPIMPEPVHVPRPDAMDHWMGSDAASVITTIVSGKCTPGHLLEVKAFTYVEEICLPSALLEATEQMEAYASECEHAADEYAAVVARARDEAMQAAEAPLAILLSLPAPTLRRSRKMSRVEAKP